MLDPPAAAATAGTKTLASKTPTSPPKAESSKQVFSLKRDISSITTSNTDKSISCSGGTSLTGCALASVPNAAAGATAVVAGSAAAPLAPSSPKRRARRRPLHVEAIVHPSCPTDLSKIRSEVKRHVQALGRKMMQYQSGTVDLSGASDVVRNGCTSVLITDLEDHFGSAGGGGEVNAVGTWLVSSVVVHAYVLSDEEASAEELETGDGNEDEDLTACETLPLPHSTLHGLWDSIILPTGIKSNLLEYAASAMLFSDRSVSTHIIGWNRVILLHGPPGTGKKKIVFILRLFNKFTH